MAGTQDRNNGVNVGEAELETLVDVGDLGGLARIEERLPEVLRLMILMYLGRVGDETQRRVSALAAVMLSESEQMERLSSREIARRCGIENSTVTRDWQEFRKRMLLACEAVGVDEFESLMHALPAKMADVLQTSGEAEG